MSGVVAPGSGPGPARVRRSCRPGQPSRAPSFVEAGPGSRTRSAGPFVAAPCGTALGVEGTRSSPGEVFPRHAGRLAVVDGPDGPWRGRGAGPGCRRCAHRQPFPDCRRGPGCPLGQPSGRRVRAGRGAQQRCVGLGHCPRYEQCGRYPAVHRWQSEGQGGREACGGPPERWMLSTCRRAGQLVETCPPPRPCAPPLGGPEARAQPLGGPEGCASCVGGPTFWCVFLPVGLDRGRWGGWGS